MTFILFSIKVKQLVVITIIVSIENPIEKLPIQDRKLTLASELKYCIKYKLVLHDNLQPDFGDIHIV